MEPLFHRHFKWIICKNLKLEKNIIKWILLNAIELYYLWNCLFWNVKYNNHTDRILQWLGTAVWQLIVLLEISSSSSFLQLVSDFRTSDAVFWKLLFFTSNIFFAIFFPFLQTWTNPTFRLSLRLDFFRNDWTPNIKLKDWLY